jgi:hypothetical protein
MSDKIFFSYSRYDSVFALRLANDLRNAGAAIWLDQLDIPPGKHWDSEIEDALNNSNCLLAILSPKSMLSNNAMDEISYALEENKKVIPVLLTDTETPFRLRRLQRVDFTGDYDIALRQLLSAIDIENIQVTKALIPASDIPRSSESTSNNTLTEERELHQKERSLLEKPGSTIHGTANKDYLKNTSTPKNNFHGINKKNILIVIILSVLLSTGWAAFIIISKQEDKKATAEIVKQSMQKVIDVKDSLKQEFKDTSSKKRALEKLDNDNLENVNIESTKNRSATVAKAEVINKRDIKLQQTEKQVDNSLKQTETIKQISNPDSIPTLPKNEEVKTEAEPNPLLPAPPEEKSISLSSDIKFDLKLLESPDMGTRRVEQHVKFSVTRDLVIEGTTILREGTIANGRITVGLKFIGLRIDKVMGVNGKIIPLKSKESDLKRHEVKKDNIYIAIIKKGTKLVY